MKNKFRRTAECEKSFWKIKETLSTKPVLKTREFTKLFSLTTDASDHGIGAEDGKLHPIGYHSRKFDAHQKNY